MVALAFVIAVVLAFVVAVVLEVVAVVVLVAVVGVFEFESSPPYVSGFARDSLGRPFSITCKSSEEPMGV